VAKTRASAAHPSDNAGTAAARTAYGGSDSHPTAPGVLLDTGVSFINLSNVVRFTHTIQVDWLFTSSW